MMRNYMRHARGEKYNFFFDAIFSPFAWLSGIIISCMDFLRRHGLLKTVEAPIPLISVGNLSYGGTNKTPFVEMLAKFAGTKGIRAGIVTRGYTGRSKKVILIRGGEGKRELTGDEPLLLSRELPNVPVAIAKQRIAGVRELQNSGCELAIADDAFQHRALGRDVDIVLIDAVCPFGNGKLIPTGILREKVDALRRADIVVLTKSEQVSTKELRELHDIVKKYISPERIFTSRLALDGWIVHGRDEKTPEKGAKVFAFSAIGSPESFRRSITHLGLKIAGQKDFRDHHKYSRRDIKNLYELAKKSGASFMICTEKDLYNFPEKISWDFDIPLIVPKVKAALNEPEKFFALLTKILRPHIVIASNGYGEDAIGVVLAKKLRKKFPSAEISAFPLVGRGEAYSREKFSVKSAPSVTPSGGVVKYSLKDLWGDMRAGLLKHIKSQLQDWKKIKTLTPICVGDVYLILHTLYGSGKRPLFAATAKTVYLSGHWRSEKLLINIFTIRTWTRDLKSAKQLGHKAFYSGSPIMDLLYEYENFSGELEKGNVILLLPGSRLRACKDVKLLLDAAEILNSRGERDFRMVLAPTLPAREFFEACKSYGWEKISDVLTKDDTKIFLTSEPIAKAAQGGKILIGLGGTANQLCAGLGIPVISIDEKGKRVQKKLLGDAELLTEANAGALAEATEKILCDDALYNSMSMSGRERMGSIGALDDIIKYACENLGWDVRMKVYEKLKGEKF